MVFEGQSVGQLSSGGHRIRRGRHRLGRNQITDQGHRAVRAFTVCRLARWIFWNRGRVFRIVVIQQEVRCYTVTAFIIRISRHLVGYGHGLTGRYFTGNSNLFTLAGHRPLIIRGHRFGGHRRVIQYVGQIIDLLHAAGCGPGVLEMQGVSQHGPSDHWGLGRFHGLPIRQLRNVVDRAVIVAFFAFCRWFKTGLAYEVTQRIIPTLTIGLHRHGVGYGDFLISGKGASDQETAILDLRGSQRFVRSNWLNGHVRVIDHVGEDVGVVNYAFSLAFVGEGQGVAQFLASLHGRAGFRVDTLHYIHVGQQGRGALVRALNTLFSWFFTRCHQEVVRSIVTAGIFLVDGYRVCDDSSLAAGQFTANSKTLISNF
ncbi:hypothetical protein D3C74_272550 [compost metagenome]